MDSTHTLPCLIELLRMHAVTAVADVRSQPYSRHDPQFNRESLAAGLREQGIAYVFLGRELGARNNDPACYENGKVQYDRLARTALFREGLERVSEGAGKHRIALLCAEKEPLNCHRAILVARHLEALGLEIRHIHADGALESHKEALDRLLRELDLPRGDMFRTYEDVIEDAYRLHGDRIAYQRSDSSE